MTYLGQSSVYNDAKYLINKFLNIINAMQVYRVTNTHGAAAVNFVDEQVAEDCKTTLKDSAVVYAQFDGSMVYTREEDWKEVKVGRLFSSAQIRALSSKRTEIDGSIYLAHLGDKDGFLAKFEPLTDVFDSLGSRFVFLTDGAPWMKKWIVESYPKATAILDIFHALEHNSEWLLLHEKDADLRTELQKKYKKILIEEGGTALIAAISMVHDKTKTAATARAGLLNYLKNNEFRMNYPLYLAQNLYIGSGAIESAQRTVVQQRLKLSGQRWTEEGAQNVLNLRTVNMSGQWHKIIDRIANHAQAA
jgi:hypothetical protein